MTAAIMIQLITGAIGSVGFGILFHIKKKYLPLAAVGGFLSWLVYSCLDLRPKNPDYIVRKTGFSPAQVSNCLVELTLRGLIRESGRHYYVKDS